MIRTFIEAWRLRRAAAEQDRLARQLGPHIARDIGLGHPSSWPVTISLSFSR